MFVALRMLKWSKKKLCNVEPWVVICKFKNRVLSVALDYNFEDCVSLISYKFTAINKSHTDGGQSFSVAEIEIAVCNRKCRSAFR